SEIKGFQSIVNCLLDVRRDPIAFGECLANGFRQLIQDRNQIALIVETASSVFGTAVQVKIGDVISGLARGAALKAGEIGSSFVIFAGYTSFTERPGAVSVGVQGSR